MEYFIGAPQSIDIIATKPNKPNVALPIIVLYL